MRKDPEEDPVSSIIYIAETDGGNINLSTAVSDSLGEGDYTVVVTLNTIYAPFINVIASPTSNQKMVVRPASLLEKYNNS